MSGEYRPPNGEPLELDPRMAKIQAVDSSPEMRDTAFGEIVGEFGPRLRAYAAQIVGPDSAEDIVQEAFLSAWEHASRHEPGSLSSWLHTITRNKAISMLRKEKETPSPDTEAIETISRSVDSPFDTLARREAIMALREISGYHLRPLMLGGMGFTAQEIADMLSQSTHMVKQDTYKGRKAARAILADYTTD